MKKFNLILNLIMVSCVGVFAAMSIYQCYDYYAHPELYTLTSIPWYTSIWLHGGVTFVIFVICVLMKVMIKHRKQK